MEIDRLELKKRREAVKMFFVSFYFFYVCHLSCLFFMQRTYPGGVSSFDMEREQADLMESGLTETDADTASLRETTAMFLTKSWAILS
jgi:hypothetical protein